MPKTPPRPLPTATATSDQKQVVAPKITASGGSKVIVRSTQSTALWAVMLVAVVLIVLVVIAYLWIGHSSNRDTSITSPGSRATDHDKDKPAEDKNTVPSNKTPRSDTPAVRLKVKGKGITVRSNP